MFWFFLLKVKNPKSYCRFQAGCHFGTALACIELFWAFKHALTLFRRWCQPLRKPLFYGCHFSVFCLLKSYFVHFIFIFLAFYCFSIDSLYSTAIFVCVAIYIRIMFLQLFQTFFCWFNCLISVFICFDVLLRVLTAFDMFCIAFSLFFVFIWVVRFNANTMLFMQFCVLFVQNRKRNCFVSFKHALTWNAVQHGAKWYILQFCTLVYHAAFWCTLDRLKTLLFSISLTPSSASINSKLATAYMESNILNTETASWNFDVEISKLRNFEIQHLRNFAMSKEYIF